MKILFDIEANGFLYEVDRVFCIVCLNIETEEMFSYGPNNIKKGISFLQKAELLVGHNILGYDIPALIKIYGDWPEYPKVLDTLTTSRFLYPERLGGHSLEDWGERLGVKKGDFHDFSRYSEEMLIYCQQDVRVNRQILKELEKENGEEFKGFSVY